MATTVTPLAVDSAQRLPGPPSCFPAAPTRSSTCRPMRRRPRRRPWRYADAHVQEIDFVEVGGPDAADPLGPGEVPNRTYDVLPHAQGLDYDDSGWEPLAPADTQRRLSQGRVCFNWYRTRGHDPGAHRRPRPDGRHLVFEVAIDDYAEVWVDGALPVALGDTGGQVVGGFNAPNRVVLTRDARPGDSFQIAVFGINGPISASPHNYIWMRTATLDFYPRERAAVGRPVVRARAPRAGPRRGRR